MKQIINVIFKAITKDYYALALMIVELLEVVEFISLIRKNIYNITVFILETIFLVLAYKYSTINATIIIIISSCCTLIPDIAFPSQIGYIWISFGIIGYSRQLLLSIITWLIATGSWSLYFMTTTQHDWSVTGLITLSGTYIGAAIIGYAISEHNRVREMEIIINQRQKEEMQYKRLMRDMALASRLHDYVTQGLSSIIIETCNLTDDHTLPEYVSKKVQIIASTSRDTLRRVRRIIDVLDGTSDQFNDELYEDNASVVNIIRLSTESGDAFLHSFDIAGSSIMHSDCKAIMKNVNKEAVNEIIALLNQIYTNILTHADASMGQYLVTVTINEREVIIYQSNSTFRTMVKNEAGKGLILHAKKIQALQGDIHTSCGDGIWILYARIPFAIKNTNDSNDIANDKSFTNPE